MKNALKAVALAIAVVGATAISAAAATLSLVDNSGGYVDQALNGSYAFVQGSGETISYLTGATKNTANGQTSGLSLDGPAQIVYTYIGSEAGNTNFSLGGLGALQFSQLSVPGTSTSGPFSVLGGLLDFAFQTTLPVTSAATINNKGGATGSPLSSFAIGYKVLAGGQSAFIYFDDIAGLDRDFDDFVVRVDVVPVPAAGFLLLGALGGLAALRRRKTA